MIINNTYLYIILFNNLINVKTKIKLTSSPVVHLEELHHRPETCVNFQSAVEVI